MFETDKFYTVGNNLSLDFVNTKIAENGQPKDLLESFNDLAAWAISAKIVERTEAEALLERWSKKGASVLREAIDFRLTLHNLFTGLVEGRGKTREGVAAINNFLRRQKGYSELVANEAGFEKRFRADLDDPLQILAPVAEAAADLLCFGDLILVRKCENTECVLFFYDTTRNHKRRWCSMAACGNRAKAAAFYERRKAQGKC